ncbi:hypothetical protein PUNSTDRAFT_45108 [Punctularia strigosozonata HHB-11173 SS5]|uniref:uncharacterized protein n=1 Tax=Punctularia strigosozonata (strain HHB-11173) TaxID=741275 RepID=UPI000441632F|nr:uncharacterized protein PUNSTDRAFT_45108 [Punctularia strigosozonata HHB-11173 SS5]EIN08679.1 hypothetical protein PUNSTDRAFT_45108 [Punctularia strigosozonata HHB-11173 SS5]
MTPTVLYKCFAPDCPYPNDDLYDSQDVYVRGRHQKEVKCTGKDGNLYAIPRDQSTGMFHCSLCPWQTCHSKAFRTHLARAECCVMNTQLATRATVAVIAAPHPPPPSLPVPLSEVSQSFPTEPSPPDPSPSGRLGAVVSGLFGGLARHFSGWPDTIRGNEPRPPLPSDHHLDAPRKRKRVSSTESSAANEDTGVHRNINAQMRLRQRVKRDVACSSDEVLDPRVPPLHNSLSHGDVEEDDIEYVNPDPEPDVAAPKDITAAAPPDPSTAPQGNFPDGSSDYDSSYRPSSRGGSSVSESGSEDEDEDCEDILVGSDEEREPVLRSPDIPGHLSTEERKLEIRRLQATVHPGLHHLQLDNDEDRSLLKRAFCVVDMQYHVLICMRERCGYAWDPAHLHGHFNNSHYQHLSYDEIERIHAICTLHDLRGAREMKKVVPRNRKIHYGLKIHPSIVFCSSCNHASVSKSSLARTHKCRALSDSSAVPSSQRTYRAKAQTFFSGSRMRRYFPVEYCAMEPIINDAAAKEACNLVNSRLIEPDFEQVPIKSPENLRQLSMFELREGWLRYVKGKSGTEIQEILDELNDPDIVDLLLLYSERYIDVALYALEDETYMIQSKLVNIGLKDEYKGSIRRTQTWPDYVRKFIPALRLAIHAARDALPENVTMPLTDDQRTSSLELFNQLENAYANNVLPVSMEQLEEDRMKTPNMERFGADRPVIEPLHRLLWSLVSHKKVSCNPSKFYTLLYNFLVLSSYDANGQLKFATIIAHMISPILYICRLSAFVQGVLYSQERDVPYLDIRLDDEGMPWIQFADKNYRTWSHHGKVISMLTIGDAILKAAEEAMRIIKDEVLCGIPITHMVFDFKRTGLVDSPHNTALHYSFALHPDNNFESYRKTLLKLWTATQRTRQRFVNKKALPGKSVWHVAEVKKVYAHYNRVQEIFLAITWFACGAPGRATEWQALIGSNTQQGHMRSLYVFTDEFYFVTGYHKNLGATGKQKVTTKLVPEQLRKLLLWSKVIVQPAMEYLVEDTHGHDARMQMYDDVFPLAAGTRRPDVLGSTWTGLMQKYLGVELNIHDARAVSAAVEAFQLNLDADMQQHALHWWHRIMAQQRGHTPETEDRFYALSFWMMRSAAPASAAVNPQVVVCVPTLESQKQTAQFVLSGVADALNPSFAHTVSSILSVIPHVSESQQTLPKEKKQIPALALKALRDLLRDLDMSFCCFERGEAITNALAGHNVLAVLPTNAGKSFVPLVIAHYYRPCGKFIAVVVPISALLQEWAKKCTRLHLSYSVWGFDNQTPEASVILVSPEHAASREFYQWAQDQAVLTKLIVLAFDECHLVVEHASFRDCFHQLARLGALSLHVILLTATTPQRILPTLLSALGSRQPQTVCAPIIRPEIKYLYRHFSDQYKAIDFIGAEFEERLKNYGPEHCAIVFAHSVSQCEDISTVLSCQVYSGQLPPQEQKEVYDQWSEVGPLVTATLALGYGINVPHVRDVFFFGLPSNFLLAQQESGWAGRDGQPARAWFIDITNPKFFRHPPKAHNLLGDTDIVSALRSTNCLQLPFSQFFDGHNISCLELANVQLCMNCEEAIRRPPPLLFPRQDPAWGESTIRPYLPLTDGLPCPNVMAFPGVGELVVARARQNEATIPAHPPAPSYSLPPSSSPVPRPATPPAPAPSALPSPPATKHGHDGIIDLCSETTYGLSDGDNDLYMDINTIALDKQIQGKGIGCTYITLSTPSSIPSSMACQIFSDLPAPQNKSNPPSSALPSSVATCLPLPRPMASTPRTVLPLQIDDVFGSSLSGSPTPHPHGRRQGLVQLPSSSPTPTPFANVTRLTGPFPNFTVPARKQDGPSSCEPRGTTQTQPRVLTSTSELIVESSCGSGGTLLHRNSYKGTLALTRSAPPINQKMRPLPPNVHKVMPYHARGYRHPASAECLPSPPPLSVPQGNTYIAPVVLLPPPSAATFDWTRPPQTEVNIATSQALDFQTSMIAKALKTIRELAAKTCVVCRIQNVDHYVKHPITDCLMFQKTGRGTYIGWLKAHTQKPGLCWMCGFTTVRPLP